MGLLKEKKEKTKKPFLPTSTFLNSPRFVVEMVFIMVGVAIILFNVLYVDPSILFLSPILNVTGGLIAVILPTILLLNRYRYSREVDKWFIVFVEDLTSSLETGMTLPVALEYAAKKDYGALSGPVQKMAAQVNWGIPFKKALTAFSARMHSVTITRAITTIIETYKAGGRIATTLRSISETLVLIDRIRKERSASVHSPVLTSYMFFFIFIFILVVLQSFLIPALSSTSVTGLTGTGPSIPEGLFAQSFTNFIIVQGFFAGLVTGKLSEGSLTAGFKHSIFLIAFGYTVFGIFSQIQFTF